MDQTLNRRDFATASAGIVAAALLPPALATGAEQQRNRGENEVHKIRRVVVARGKDGKSMKVFDGPQPAAWLFGSDSIEGVKAATMPPVTKSIGPVILGDIPDPGKRQTVQVELWKTDNNQLEFDGSDPCAGIEQYVTSAPSGSTQFRLSIFGPDVDIPIHGGGHQLIYNFVVDGSITLKLESGEEVALAKTDSIISSKARVGWRTGKEGCTMLYIQMNA